MAELKDTTINGDLTVTGVINGGFYKPGDTLTLVYNGAGYVTSSGTNFCFQVPIPQVSDSVSGVTMTKGDTIVRQGGKYLIGTASDYESILSGGTVTCILYPGSVRIAATRSSAPSGVSNNDSFGIVSTITFKFT